MNLLKWGIEQSIIKPSGFVTVWRTTSDVESITLPFYDSGVFNCIVNWGDGTPDSTITTWDSTDRTHSYAIAGDYTVTITGDCPAWSFNNTGSKLKIIKIVNWGTPDLFSGFNYLINGFYGCTNLTTLGIGKILIVTGGVTSLTGLFNNCSALTSIPQGIFDNCINTLDFNYCFYGCTNLTSLPADIFRYNIAVTSFSNCFLNCSGLTSLPVDLFRYNINIIYFTVCFYGCSGLTALPVDLFRYNTAATTFSVCFYGCTNLTSLPADLFRYNTAAIYLDSCFLYCSSLTSLPVDLFRYNTAVIYLSTCFYGCTGLTTLPVDLFRYNTVVNTFGNCFYGCSGLTTVPVDLFRYNTVAASFSGCFRNCINLQLNSNIFYADGEQATRFLNKKINFANVFYRTSYSGSQGIAPDLWNCNFGTETPTTTTSFGGNGNNLTSISNYNDIPSAWK